MQMKRLNKFMVTGSLGLWMLAAPAIAADAVPGTVRDLERLGGDIERVSAAVGPKVVQIATQSLKVAGNGDEEPAGVLVAERGRGSGFFVSSDGYLLTNAHVVANATRIRVLVPAPDGAKGASPREYSATVVGIDADNDLALLKVDIQGVPFFDLTRDATARQGQLVLAYGSPMGLAQSASLGPGQRGRPPTQLPTIPGSYIQTDASMNPGNSGGPLVDLDGKLLGVNTMILSQSGGSEGLGFAVPLEVIRHSYTALRAGGTVARPRLGIQPRSLTADLIAGLGLKVRQGVLVEDVDPYGPARCRGPASGRCAGLTRRRAHSHFARSLSRRIRPLRRRARGTGGHARARCAASPHHARPAPQDARRPCPPEASRKRTIWCFALACTEPPSRRRWPRRWAACAATPACWCSRSPERAWPGQNALEPADVIHAVNGKPVDSVESLRSTLEAIPDGAPMVLQVERDGLLSYVTPGRHARRRAAPQEDRFPRACRESPRPSAPFRIEDRQASAGCAASLSGALAPPKRRDASRMAERGISPPIFKLASACIPAEAIQPHSSQTGLPPNWHGVTRVCRSAERQLVSLANVHSSGERGGRR